MIIIIGKMGNINTYFNRNDYQNNNNNDNGVVGDYSFTIPVEDRPTSGNLTTLPQVSP